jgi:hypothetical protein
LTHPPYPTARAVAPVIYKHFKSCVDSDAAVPDVDTIEHIIDIAFWASLRKEEGRFPRISIAYLTPEQAVTPLLFARPLAFEAAALARVAPAVERPGIHLGVTGIDGDLRVWGTTRRIPPSTFILEVIDAGVLVVKRRRSEAAGKYANVVVLEGDKIKLVDDQREPDSQTRPVITTLVGVDSARSWSDPVNVTVQLATSMRAHQHGGTLLMVPAESTRWKDSIVEPIAYEVIPAYQELHRLVRQKADPGDELLWRERLRRAVEAVAGLTAVDGATVMNDRYELLAFGAKIRRERSKDQVQQVVVWEPVVGVMPAIVNVADIGGTRHLSAAQFVKDQRDALALVASQDGRFTVFAWSEPNQLVGAYRVEALLL